MQATYTNGILSTQNLLQQLEDVQKTKPQGVAAGPPPTSAGAPDDPEGAHPQAGDRIRTFLTADVLGFLLRLIDRTEKDGGELYLALYELHDPELIARLTKLTKAGKAHVILSTAGSENLTPKKTRPPSPGPTSGTPRITTRAAACTRPRPPTSRIGCSTTAATSATTSSPSMSRAASRRRSSAAARTGPRPVSARSPTTPS